MNRVTNFFLTMKYCLNKIYIVTGIKLTQFNFEKKIILEVYESRVSVKRFIKQIIPVSRASPTSTAPYSLDLDLLL